MASITRALPARLTGVFYGWWIVLASMAALSVAAGMYWQGAGVFFLPISDDLGASRAAFSGAIAISQLEGGLLGPIGGYLVDRFGPRRMMLIGVSIMGLGFVVMSQVDSLVMFYVVYLALISVGMSIGIRVPALVAPSMWFIRKRSLALGISTSGGGAGGVFVPILGLLIAQIGWRTTATIAGIFIWAVGLPLALVMRRRPEYYGLLPDGRRPAAASDPAESEAPSTAQATASTVDAEDEEDNEAQYTLMQALRTPVFWLLALVFGFRQFIVSAVSLHQVPFLVGIGIRPELAATVLGTTAVLSMLGRIGFGFLGDRIPKRFVMSSAIAMVSLSSLILANVTEWWQLIFFVLLYAIGWGGGASLMFALRAEYFGRNAFGTISGTMDFVQMFGLVLGPIFAGSIYDLTDSYYLAFMTFAVVGAISAAAVFFLRPPNRTPRAAGTPRG